MQRKRGAARGHCCTKDRAVPLRSVLKHGPVFLMSCLVQSWPQAVTLDLVQARSVSLQTTVHVSASLCELV